MLWKISKTMVNVRIIVVFYAIRNGKFAFIENNDGTGNNWKYVEYNNGNIEYNICNN